MMKKNLAIIVLSLVAASLLAITIDTSRRLKQCEAGNGEVYRDTIVDTIRIVEPVLVDSVVVRYETVVLPVADASADGGEVFDNDGVHDDSIVVAVPIVQKHYSEEEYDAWVSGYHPQLDSINVYPREVQTYFPLPVVKKEQPKIALVVGPSIGMTDKGFAYGVTLTLGINLWSK